MKALAQATAALMALGSMMVTSAWAIDMTGTWKDAGSQCKSLTASGEKVRLKKMVSAKTYPVNPKGYTGTIRGSVWFGSSGEVRVCKVTFKRTSTADPGPISCP